MEIKVTEAWGERRGDEDDRRKEDEQWRMIRGEKLEGKRREERKKEKQRRD